MILFPTIWWLFPAACMLLLVVSLFITRSGKRENEFQQKVFVALGALLGFIALALPLFKQPVFQVSLINYGLGIPLAAIGLVGRIYPMVYLQSQGTTTTMKSVAKLVDSGPYAWVRHPQYTAGLVMMLGWFLIWGAWYALGLLPLIAVMIFAQARIEEKYILQKQFGEAYAAYQERVGMLLPRLGKKDPLRITTALLGVYAGLIAIQHGIFEVFQGNISPDGLLFNAIGPPCLPEMVWHACFPAMTLIPNLFASGVATIIIGVMVMLWALFFVSHRYGGRILFILSILQLMVGSGFVPVFIGMVAAIASLGLRRWSSPGRLALLEMMWPWPLILMFLWLPGSWLLGHFFSGPMLSLSLLLFFVFDIGLPVLAAVSGFAHRNYRRRKNNDKSS